MSYDLTKTKDCFVRSLIEYQDTWAENPRKLITNKATFIGLQEDLIIRQLSIEVFECALVNPKEPIKFTVVLDEEMPDNFIKFGA